MSVYDERREELDKYEFMMGAGRGRLAMTLDLLTDALVPGGRARRLLPKRAPGGQAGHGHPDDLEMPHGCQGTGARRNGGAKRT